MYLRIVSVIILVYVPLVVAQAQWLSLEEAITLALDNQEEISIIDKNIALSRYNQSYANAGFLPTVEATASQNFNIANVNQTFLSGTSNERLNAKSATTNANLGFDWVIFDGGRMFKTYQRLGQLVSSQEIRKEIIKQSITQQVCLLYYDLIRQAQRLKSLENNLLISAQRLQLARDNYEIGTGSKLEYLNAQVDYNTDQAAILSQEQSIENAKIRMNRWVGRAVDTDFETQDSIIVMLDSLRFETLQNDMQQNNWQVKSLQQNQQIIQTQMAETKAQKNFPTISLTADYNFTRATSEAGFLISNQNYGLTYGVTARMMLFGGFNFRRQLQNQKISLDINQEEIKSLKNDLEATLAEEYNNYQKSLQRAQLAQQNLEIAKQNISIALDRYKIGVATPLEFRQTQNNAITTENQYIEALYQAKIAEINLLALANLL